MKIYIYSKLTNTVTNTKMRKRRIPIKWISDFAVVTTHFESTFHFYHDFYDKILLHNLCKIFARNRKNIIQSNFQRGDRGWVIPTFLNQTILDKIGAKDFCLKRTTPLALPRRWSFFARIFWSAACREWLPKNQHKSQTQLFLVGFPGSAIGCFLGDTLDKQRTKICVQKMTIAGGGPMG